jgi:hypothetical protein
MKSFYSSFGVMKTNKKFADEISNWSKEGLSRLFGNDILDKPEVIADIGMAGLKLAIGLGPKSLREIAEALYELGYINEISDWLDGKL